MTIGNNVSTKVDIYGLKKIALFKNLDKYLFGNLATMPVIWPITIQ